MKAWNSTHYLISVLFLALLLRGFWAFFIPVVPISDSHAYDMFARTLALHGTFGWTATEPFAFWPVGVSAVYALLYKIFGINFIPIVLFNIALNIGFILCCYFLARHFFNEQIALITALMLALWPSHIFLATILSSELLYMFLTALAAAFWFLPNTSQIRYFILCGIVLALACYVRPTALLLPIAFATGYIIWKRDWRRQVIGCLISFTVIALLIAPWTYRNYKLYNAFIPISTNGGITFWMGNNKSGSLDYAPVPESLNGLNDYEQSKRLKKEALDYIKAEPLAFIGRMFKKIFHLHSHETIGVNWNEKGIESVLGSASLTPLKGLTQIYWVTLLALSLTGLVFLIRDKGFGELLFHPLIMIWLYYISIHSIIVAQDRYHFSFAISVAILAAYATQYLKEKIKTF